MEFATVIGNSIEDHHPFEAALHNLSEIIQKPATAVVAGLGAIGSGVTLFAMDPNAIAMAFVSALGGAGAIVVTVYTAIRKADKENGTTEIKQLNKQVAYLNKQYAGSAQLLKEHQEMTARQLKERDETIKAQNDTIIDLLGQIRTNSLATRVSTQKTEEHSRLQKRTIKQVEKDTKAILEKMPTPQPDSSSDSVPVVSEDTIDLPDAPAPEGSGD